MDLGPLIYSLSLLITAQRSGMHKISYLNFRWSLMLSRIILAVNGFKDSPL